MISILRRGTEIQISCAFLEENELAYTATADPTTFPAFAQSLPTVHPPENLLYC